MPLPLRLVIVRHGEREDHINRAWKKTADRPHDSPLSTKGAKMAVELGIHYMDRLADVAFSLYADAATTATTTLSSSSSSSTSLAAAQELADKYGFQSAPAIAYLATRWVVLSSPLTRCVETSHGIIEGFRMAAQTYILTGDPRGDAVAALNASGNANAVRKLLEAAVGAVAIVVEDALVEEDKWMSYDLRSAPVVMAKGPPQPVLFDAAHHQAKTSAHVNVAASVRPSLLAPIGFRYGEGARVEEVSLVGVAFASGAPSASSSSNGKRGSTNKCGSPSNNATSPSAIELKAAPKQNFEERVTKAVAAFVGNSASATASSAANGTAGSAFYNNIPKNAIVFLVSHGVTTVRWYNALLQAHGESLKRHELFAGSAAYTAFAELSRLDRGAGFRYVASSAAFGTPHLTGPAFIDDHDGAAAAAADAAASAE